MPNVLGAPLARQRHIGVAVDPARIGEELVLQRERLLVINERAMGVEPPQLRAGVEDERRGQQW